MSCDTEAQLFRDRCRDMFSQLSPLCIDAGVESMYSLPNGKPVKESIVDDESDMSDWLCTLSGKLSSMKSMQCVDQQFIMKDVLLYLHDIRLRTVVNYFTFHAFKARCCSHGPAFDKEIMIIFQHGFADMFEKDVLKMLCSEIELFVSKKQKGCYDEQVLHVIETWVSTMVYPFTKAVFNKTHAQFRDLSDYFVSHCRIALSKARGPQLFDMIRDFPDSAPAIRELRVVSQATGMMSSLGKTLKRALISRLLHLGAATSDIIDLYVKMIRCFRILDPSNLLLNHVAKPIRKYLVSRKDTIRCIVSSLTEGEDDNLQSELRGGRSLEYGAGNDSDDDEDESPDMEWRPSKRALDIPDGRTEGQKKDVLALLVSIYGSTDLFVSEYRSILATRLLQNVEYISDVEVKTLELLKIRFGEEPLHSCEVMLHDLNSSRRLNTAITAEMKSKMEDYQMDSAAVVNYCIVSDEYWPSLHLDSSITHHPRAARLQSLYCETFNDVKKPKKLEAAPQLGQVFLELDFEDGSNKEFVVSPTQASLILLVSEAERGIASIQYLSQASDLEETEVKKCMVYWVSRRVVREVAVASNDQDFGLERMSGEAERPTFCLGYEVIENQRELESRDQNDDDLSEFADDSDFGGSLSAEAMETLAFSSYESFIRGMLQNQDGMQLERIHSMLKMVMGGDSGPRYDLSIVQLKKFLQTLIAADKIEIVDNVYKLRK